MLACMRTAAVYGIDAARSTSRSTCRSDSRASRWSACPTRRSARAGIACGARSATPASTSRHNRVTVNLAPADIRKAGASFDLPIALGVLAATGCVTRRDVDDVLLLGELSLDGGIHPARGVLPIAAAARRERFTALLLPRPNRARGIGGRRASSLSGPFARRSGRRAQRSGRLPRARRRRGGGARGPAPRWPRMPTSRTSTARRSAAARSRSRRPAVTTR